MTDLVQVARYSDRMEAVIARGLLESNGIDALIPELYTLEADPGLVFAMGGLRILVPDDQAEAARLILRDLKAAADEA